MIQQFITEVLANRECDSYEIPILNTEEKRALEVVENSLI